MNKRVLFLTGTRADFGKLKPLISEVIKSDELEAYIFVTGMHTLTRYGNTVDEVYRNFSDDRMSSGFRRIFVFRNQGYNEPMEQALASTIVGLSRYVQELSPDLLVVHGDRIEALAGAIVGSIRNIRVAHVEGGEVSGTIDELLRHSTSKLSHLHFVATQDAGRRLVQLGELESSIFNIGSPEIDLMLSDEVPSEVEAKFYYGIDFDRYALVIFHPITTDLKETAREVDNLVQSIVRSPDMNFVVIYPNNDEGCDLIFSAYRALEGKKNVKIFPSMREDYFFSLLRSSDYIIGNSSAGIIEAPVYGVPTINISNRQSNRFRAESIMNIKGGPEEMVAAMNLARQLGKFPRNLSYGRGDSAQKFIAALQEQDIWKVSPQKQFIDFSRD